MPSFIIRLAFKLCATIPTLLVQLAAKLAHRHVRPNVQTDGVVLHAIPGPLVLVLGVSLDVVLPRTPCVQAEGDLGELWADRQGVALVGAHGFEALAGVVPDPQRIPERIADGLCTEG